MAKKGNRMISFLTALSILLTMCVGSITLNSLKASAASTAPKPGEAAYYRARWDECFAKFKWANTGLTPWNGTTVQPTTGSGTPADPYIVTTAEQLRWCLQNQKSLRLDSNIDLGGQNGRNWTGISIATANVLIDGDGHTIYNLFSESGTTGVFGLIGKVTTAGAGFKMQNLNLSNAYVHVTATGANYFASALIGQFNAGTVDNCVGRNIYVNGNNGTTNGVAPLFAPDGSGGTGITITNTKAINCNVYGAGCVSGFIEGPWGNATSLTVENCAAMDGIVISTGGHSGGFTSCVAATNATYRNCYINDDVYGNNETGVFVGVTHAGTHVFENCYAAGKIEGTTNIGGFFGNPSSSTRETFTNCYSTSMVGMASGGNNMGGFAGVAGGTSYFNNCYAAGEVGTLHSKEDGTPIGASNVTGFIGNNGGTAVNCYYDKQTTGMCNYGTKSGVTGLLTRELIAKPAALNDSVWVTSDGGYPELKVFAESDDGIFRAYSTASVSTVHLYASDNGSDYDTVRRIRYVFPLTNNKNSGKSDFNISWGNYEGEDPEHPLYPNVSPIIEGEVPIIALSNVGTEDSVSSVAPGIGWLQVNAMDKQSGIVGMRRLRLVPTTAIASAAFNDALLGVTDIITLPTKDGSTPPEGLTNLDDTEEAKLTYDHRTTINFVTTNSESLNSFLLDDKEYPTLEDKLNAHKDTVTTKKFPDGIIPEILDNGELSYPLGTDLGDDTLVVKLEKLKEDGTYEEIPWTDELIDLFEGRRTAEDEETGGYRLKYEWRNQNGTVLKAEGSKSIEIVDQAYAVFHNNYTVPADMNEICDAKGYFRGGTPMGNENMPQDPAAREGYTFMGWSSDINGTVIDNDNGTTSVSSPFGGTTRLTGGRNDVYAVWRINSHGLTIKGYDTTDPIAEEPEVDYDTPLLEQIEKLMEGKEPPESDTEFLGWSTEPDGIVNIDETTKMPDHPVEIYPVYASKPVITVKVENITSKEANRDENNVGDTFRYTITVSNEGPHSVWQDVTIRNQLPPGLNYIPNSASIKYNIVNDAGEIEEKTEPISDADIYDADGHKVLYEIGNMPAGAKYEIVFDLNINEKAVDVSDTPEGEENRDISNEVEILGKDSDGDPIGDPVDDPKNPETPENPDNPDNPGGDDPENPDNPDNPGDDPENPDDKKPQTGSTTYKPDMPNTKPDEKPEVVPFDPEDGDVYVKVDVVNKTHLNEEPRVNDVLEHTVTVGNEKTASKWADVTIKEKLPDGLDLIPDSIYLIKPDGSKEKLTDSNVYNPDTREVNYVINAIGGGQEYKLVFETTINDKTVTDPDKSGDIGTTVTVTGKTPHDNPIETKTDEPAYPTEDNKKPVVRYAKPDGRITQTVENLTHKDKTVEGDVLLITVTGKNHGVDSLWTDVVLFDKIPEGYTIDTDSITVTKPDGTKVDVKGAAYDEKTGLVSVYVGGLYYNEAASVSFKVTVNKKAVGGDIGNQIFAYGGEDGNEPSWIGGGTYNIGDVYTPTDLSALEKMWIIGEIGYPDSGGGQVAGIATTGDTSNVWLWFIALLCSASVLGVCAAVKKKFKNQYQYLH